VAQFSTTAADSATAAARPSDTLADGLLSAQKVAAPSVIHKALHITMEEKSHPNSAAYQPYSSTGVIPCTLSVPNSAVCSPMPL